MNQALPFGPNSIRRKVWDKTKGQCWYCGIKLIPANTARRPNEFVLDHLVPKFMGGGHTIDNLVPACWTCNSRKGSKTVEEFRDLYARLSLGIPWFNDEQHGWLFQQGFDVRKMITDHAITIRFAFELNGWLL